MRFVSLIYCIFLCLSSHSFAQTDGAQVVGETPLVVFKMPANQKDVLPALNLMANSLAYGLSTDAIRNGSGTGSPQALAPQGITEQGLRALSLVDLYFSYGVAQHQIRPMDLGIQIVPYWPSLDSRLVDLKLKGAEDLQALLQPIFPLIKPSIKSYPAGKVFDSVYAADMRGAQLAALQRRFPVIASYNSLEPMGKLVWLVQAFAPFYGDIQIKITPTSGVASTTLFSPPLGILSLNKQQLQQDPVNAAQKMQILPFELSSAFPVSDPRHIAPIETTVAQFTRISLNPNHQIISNAKLTPEQEELRKFRSQGRVIRTAIRKNYADPDRLNLDVSFGYLPQGTRWSTQMDVDLNKGRALVDNMDFALLISGQMGLTKDVVKDPRIRQILNDYLKNLDIHLAVHKLALTMTRSPVVQNGGKLIKLQYWQNANWMFQYDPGFPLQNIEMIPEQSLISFKVKVKAQALEQLKSTSWWAKLTDAEKGRQSRFVKTFCALSDDYEKERPSLLNPVNVLSLIFTKKILEKPCEITAISVKDFKQKFIGQFINKMISAEGTKNVKASVDPQLQSIDDIVDPMMKTLTMQITKEIQKSRGEAQEVLQLLMSKSALFSK